MENESKLITVLEKLDISLKTLEDRKILQKKIYFLEQLGLKLGYDFGFYIYGPYSSDLTKDAFSYYNRKNIMSESIVSNKLSKRDESSFKQLNKLLEGVDEQSVANELELLSSIHFLKNISYIQINDVKKMQEEIKKRKPGRFSNKRIEVAWNKLKRYKLIS